MITFEHPTSEHVSFCVNGAKYSMFKEVAWAEANNESSRPTLQRAAEFLAIEGAANPKQPLQITAKDLANAFISYQSSGGGA